MDGFQLFHFSHIIGDTLRKCLMYTVEDIIIDYSVIVGAGEISFDEVFVFVLRASVFVENVFAVDGLKAETACKASAVRVIEIGTQVNIYIFQRIAPEKYKAVKFGRAFNADTFKRGASLKGKRSYLGRIIDSNGFQLLIALES